jgi:hypothetical protein
MTFSVLFVCLFVCNTKRMSLIDFETSSLLTLVDIEKGCFCIRHFMLDEEPEETIVQHFTEILAGS